MNESTNEFYLKQIIRYVVNDGRYLLRRPHLANRKLWTGLIGPQGDGKTYGAGIILLVDYMLDDMPVWANFDISCTFDITDEAGWRFANEMSTLGYPVPSSIKGGSVTYQSLPLDREALLRFDPRYSNGALGLDEINVEFAEARRAGSNVNLFFDNIGQQSRHENLHAVYTTISEMWVDPRIRNELTDIFIKSRDLALSPAGLWLRKPLGIDFKWTIFGMSRLYNGESYYDTGKSADEVEINAKPFDHIIDTRQKQTGKGKYTIDFKQPPAYTTPLPDIERSSAIVQEYDRWGWLYDAIQQLHEQGVEAVIDRTLWDYLGIQNKGISTKEVGKQLAIMGITKHQIGGGGYEYIIDNYNLGSIPKKKKELILVK